MRSFFSCLPPSFCGTPRRSPMYVYPYISETHGTKKALHQLAKRLRVKSAPKREHGTRSIPRDLEKRLFPYPADGRFPGSRRFIRRLPGFPVAAPHGARRTFPHTVTRSHRPCTCFPFTLCPSCSKGTDCFCYSVVNIISPPRPACQDKTAYRQGFSPSRMRRYTLL